MSLSNKKPLNSYEQSMLLSTMLFDPENVDEILEILPTKRAERVKFAKDKFFNLDENERITEIILELRRLLIIGKNEQKYIHPSWIDYRIKEEPRYLQNFIKSSLQSKKDKGKDELIEPNGLMSLALITNCFFSQFNPHVKRRALFDPILIRLQSIQDLDQVAVFSEVGEHVLLIMNSVLHKNRLKKWLAPLFIRIKTNENDIINNNILKDKKLKKIFTKLIIKNKKNILMELGLTLVAIYVSFENTKWHNSIILSMQKDIGEKTLEKINYLKNQNFNKEIRSKSFEILLKALDKATCSSF